MKNASFVCRGRRFAFISLSVQHIFQFFKDAFRSDARDAGIALGADSRAVERTGAAGHIELDDAIMFTRGEEAPLLVGWETGRAIEATIQLNQVTIFVCIISTSKEAHDSPRCVATIDELISDSKRNLRFALI